jgi:hypothetical protein
MLGSASSRPDPGILGVMLAAPVWFVATDADEAGDKAASGWLARARRVRPPAPCKDSTEAAQAGLNQRCLWLLRFGRESLWNGLATWRWGPARDDSSPGIIIDRPDPARYHAALQSADYFGAYALAERVAIQEENR